MHITQFRYVPALPVLTILLTSFHRRALNQETVSTLRHPLNLKKRVLFPSFLDSEEEKNKKPLPIFDAIMYMYMYMFPMGQLWLSCPSSRSTGILKAQRTPSRIILLVVKHTTFEGAVRSHTLHEVLMVMSACLLGLCLAGQQRKSNHR